MNVIIAVGSLVSLVNQVTIVKNVTTENIETQVILLIKVNL
jgi:hypothetical protein